MPDEIATTREQVCAVPFRLRSSRPEFCLVAINGDSRWDFPRGNVLLGESSHTTALRRALEVAGLECEMEVASPLDQFAASTTDAAEVVTAFLIRVENESLGWPGSNGHRRRWCFAEEARVRIRRKPVRRLVDLAVRYLET